eukprot:scaffold36031_cov152-Isochrysis_galbana.AAC.4
MQARSRRPAQNAAAKPSSRQSRCPCAGMRCHWSARAPTVSSGTRGIASARARAASAGTPW